MNQKEKFLYLLCCIWGGVLSIAAMKENVLTYRHFNVIEENGAVVSTEPIPSDSVPMWADDVSQQPSVLSI